MSACSPCLLLLLLLLRFAALARLLTLVRSKRYYHTRHHSSLGLRRHLFPLSDDCRPPTHASPPLLQLHLTQTFTSDNTTTIPSNPIHARYSLRLLAARTALCRPRSLALHIASPIHIPASASRIHHPRRAPYSAKLSPHPRPLFKATTAYEPACPTLLVSSLSQAARCCRCRHEFRIL